MAKKPFPNHSRPYWQCILHWYSYHLLSTQILTSHGCWGLSMAHRRRCILTSTLEPSLYPIPLPTPSSISPSTLSHISHLTRPRLSPSIPAPPNCLSLALDLPIHRASGDHEAVLPHPNVTYLSAQPTSTDLPPHSTD
jgi:hypothetical protein